MEKGKEENKYLRERTQNVLCTNPYVEYIPITLSFVEPHSKPTI